MLNTFARLTSTVAIWIAATLMAAAGSGNVNGFDFVILTAVLMVGGTLATRYVWQTIPVVEVENAEKAKRTGTTRVRRVLDSLSDEEMDELRARLSADDGELVSIEALLGRRK